MAKARSGKSGGGSKAGKSGAGGKSGRARASKRERISPRGDTRFVRRNAKGEFDESDDAGKSLRVDRRKKAKRTVRSGQGDKGDRAK